MMYINSGAMIRSFPQDLQSWCAAGVPTRRLKYCNYSRGLHSKADNTKLRFRLEKQMYQDRQERGKENRNLKAYTFNKIYSFRTQKLSFVPFEEKFQRALRKISLNPRL